MGAFNLGLKISGAEPFASSVRKKPHPVSFFLDDDNGNRYSPFNLFLVCLFSALFDVDLG